jgi:zinc transporter ZupT
VSDNASIISVDKSLVLAVLFGDSLCNFCDGVFIGIAVSLCNSSIAWAVIGVTLYHEVAQELADYFLLTKIAGLTPFKALTLNFVTGLSVVVGGLLTLVLDMSDMVIGVLLGLASGVYIYISTCECLPRVDKYLVSYKERLIFFAMFALGAIPLGLTLLGHVHCDA